MVKQNATFDHAVRSFSVYCRAKGLAKRTLETYESALNQLRGHIEREDGLIPIPTRHDLRALSGSMLEHGLARGTIRVRMRSIRVFANFLEREGLNGA